MEVASFVLDFSGFTSWFNGLIKRPESIKSIEIIHGDYRVALPNPSNDTLSGRVTKYHCSITDMPLIKDVEFLIRIHLQVFPNKYSPPTYTIGIHPNGKVEYIPKTDSRVSSICVKFPGNFADNSSYALKIISFQAMPGSFGAYFSSK